jgi:hypothetical protein
MVQPTNQGGAPPSGGFQQPSSWRVGRLLLPGVPGHRGGERMELEATSRPEIRGMPLECAGDNRGSGRSHWAWVRSLACSRPHPHSCPATFA